MIVRHPSAAVNQPWPEPVPAAPGHRAARPRRAVPAGKAVQAVKNDDENNKDSCGHIDSDACYHRPRRAGFRRGRAPCPRSGRA
jgi:hypothetical protein